MWRRWHNYDDSDEEECYERDSEAAEFPEDEDGEITEYAYSNAVQNIGSLLNRVQVEGEFSFGGRALSLPSLPLLDVESVGVIAMPFLPGQAKELIEVCEKAPYGRNEETLVDENVRKSWQLPPTKFKIRNPAWDIGMKPLSEDIADKLGCPNVELEIKPYKLLVYGPGGHFVRHRDTEKEEGMFATLVLQLPSMHTGGSLIVYNKDKKFVHDFGAETGQMPYGIHYAVHYADSEHEVTPITDGYRLALIYSICWPKTQPAERMPSENAKSGIDLMACEIQNMLDTDYFVQFLEHEYTEIGIRDRGVGYLKGIDRERYNSFAKANKLIPQEGNRLKFYLVEISYSKSYSGDDRYWEEYESDLEFHRWYTTDGRLVCSVPTDFSEKYILNPDEYDRSQLWGTGRATYEGYLGNGGATRTLTYKKFGLLAWRQSQDLFKCLTFMKKLADLSNLLPQTFDSKYADNLLSYLNRNSQTISLKNFRFLLEKLLTLNHSTAAQKLIRDQKLFESRLINVADISPQWKVIVECYLGFNLQWSTFKDSIVHAFLRQSDLPVLCKLLQNSFALPKVALRDLVYATANFVKKKNDSLIALDETHEIGLWKVFVTYLDNNDLKKVIKIYERLVDTKMILKKLMVMIKAIPSKAPQKSFLAPLISKRLKKIIPRIKNPAPNYSYKYPKATFPNPQIQEFLRSDKDCIFVRKFTGIAEARAYVITLSQTGDCSLFTMAAGGIGRNSYVVVKKKAKHVIDEESKKLLQYKKELEYWKTYLGSEFETVKTAAENPIKREPEVIVLDEDIDTQKRQKTTHIL